VNRNSPNSTLQRCFAIARPLSFALGVITNAEFFEASEDELCGIKVPSVESVMAEIKEHMLSTFNKASKDAKDSAHEFYNDLGCTLHEIFE